MEARATWEREHEEEVLEALLRFQNLGLVPPSSDVDVQVSWRNVCVDGRGCAAAVLDLGAHQDERRTVLLVKGNESVLQCIKQHFLIEKGIESFGCVYADQTYEEKDGSRSFVLLKVTRLVEGNALPVLFTFDFVGMEEVTKTELREAVVELVKDLMTKLKVRNMCRLASFTEEHTLRLIPELARSFSTILSLFPPEDVDKGLFLERCNHIEGEISDQLATAVMRRFISLVPNGAHGSDEESFTTHRE